MSVTTATKEKFGFKADEKQLLNLVIHSLYSNKEIFLRELISNASDAADKLRFESLSKAAVLENDTDLKIWVEFDEQNKTITVRDNGIGMTREEVMQNLGTIAKSGTKEFLTQLTGEQKHDAKLIGQFGVGFYSAFIIADKVEVKTRRAGLASSEGVLWTSIGEGEYELENIDKPERGTEVIMHIRAGEEEFLSAWRLREIIKKYSDHINLPILMLNTPKENEQPEFEVINRATALWTLPKSEITDEQYKELYKHVAHDFEDPLEWAHNRVEGKQEYTSLLYIPARAPFDLWNPNKARGVKLYVQRVFIMDDAEQFLPHYLRFVRGIVDSRDLPLNISREILQNNRLIDSIKSGLTKRVLSMLENMATSEPEKFKKFWQEFGQVLKEGPAEDFANKQQIAKILRFATSHKNTEEQNVSLDEYVSRLPGDQDKIFYITAETFNAAKNSPHLEIFRKKNIEVLLLSDRVDEWLVTHLGEYTVGEKNYKFESVAKGALDLGNLDSETEKEAQKQAEEEYKGMLEHMQKVLTDRVKSVRLTNRLTASPACVVVDTNDMSSQMERIMKAAGQHVPTSKPILELNPDHLMIQRLKDVADEEQFKDWSFVLLEQAILSEGGHLEDPASFVARFNKLLLEMAA